MAADRDRGGDGMDALHGFGTNAEDPCKSGTRGQKTGVDLKPT